MFNHDELRQQAFRLMKAINQGGVHPRDGRYALSVCQELAGQVLGAAHWHEAMKNAERRGGPTSSKPVRTSVRLKSASPSITSASWDRWPTLHLLQHTLVIGEAGRAKTTALMSLALTARDHSRGLIWINAGSGDAIHASLTAHNVGRMDPVQLLDFTKVANGPMHQFNPAAWLDANDTIAWLVGLGRGRVNRPQGWSVAGWQQRAFGVWAAVVPALVWLRDHHGLTLNMDTLLRSITWEGLNNLWNEDRLPDDERGALRHYISPWFTSTDATSFMAPVAPAWESAIGILRTIGPHLDTTATLAALAGGGNLYRMIEQREVMMANVPAQWAGDNDPRSLAYESFVRVLAQVIQTQGSGLRKVDPTHPVPWRVALLLDQAPSMGLVNNEVLNKAQSRGVAVVFAYSSASEAQRAGISPTILDGCGSLLQLPYDDDALFRTPEGESRVTFVEPTVNPESM